ncbi:MAG: hypothetical protein KDA93_23905 [Planctomycetaceae bacterium]|nr:hypothetical protein [Planctomycetaceae bacterium]
MLKAGTHPSWRISTLILVSLSLSIGWGVRGNFGHEYGAMLPGVLAGIAACLMSGREDWRQRVPYFGFFGALGWGFGGSFSYMKVVGYTHSGHLPSVLFGFFGLFLGSFLWAALGGACTAYAAAEDRDRLADLFKPLCWVLVAWAAFYFFWDRVMNLEPVVQFTGGRVSIIVEKGLERELRQNDPFYWLDTDWVQALFALVAICAFDLWDRRSRDIGLLPLYAVFGGAVGWGVQWVLGKIGLLTVVLPWFVRVQGDLTINNPDTGLPFDPANMVTNWPTIFFAHSEYVGLFFGLTLGIAIYFARYGKWRSGSSLLLHMALGWFVVFLLCPVLLGIRVTPPRNDNWAGGLGVFLGILLYVWRNNLLPVAVASVVCGTIGGLGIAFTQCLKLLLVAPGNPNRLADLPTEVRDPIVERWAHWQSANWHSIVIEQGVGLLYGLGLAVAMAMLATRLRPVQQVSPERRWTQVFSVAFLMTVLLYLSMIKNVTEWTKERSGGFRMVAESMKMPLIESIELSARSWFQLGFLLYSICIIVLLVVHTRRKLAIVPATWLGKGQLLYLTLLWIIIVFNFEKALGGFTESRLATEGVLFVNAVIATFMIIFFAREQDSAAMAISTDDYRPLFRRSLVAMLTAVAVATFAFTGIVRMVYGDHFAGHAGNQRRFGAEADWRLRPVLRDVDHR